MTAFQAPNFYEILNLSEHADLRPQDVKAAYKKALLAHHPDKKGESNSSRLTVDDIALAYKVLSDISLKRDYDQELQLARSQNSKPTIFHTGLETADLDDLVYNESTHTWHRSCRCADTNGFVITEAELEANAEDGELITGCRGCSLWLRVLYSID